MLDGYSKHRSQRQISQGCPTNSPLFATHALAIRPTVTARTAAGRRRMWAVREIRPE
jgi:hypothetical protein